MPKRLGKVKNNPFKFIRKPLQNRDQIKSDGKNAKKIIYKIQNIQHKISFSIF